MQQGLSANSIKLLERAHLDQLALCKALESIADSLPDGLDGRVCAEAARSLGPVTTRAHALEEEILFPVLVQSDLMHFDFGPTIERLRLEHYEDECFAEELRDVLVSCAQSDPPQSAEAMGYMLRGFFESIRRHIAFERELLESIVRASSRKTPS
jgi:hemerythrin-like domain-containing protein